MPPIENEGLLVSVRVVDGGTVIRTLQEDILQPGGPTGTSYQLPWDLKNDSGVDVNVNRSYRFVVSADRAAPSTASAELVNANPKEAVLLVFGSARVTSDDGVLSLSYRPEETKVVIKSRPVLTHSQLRRLAGRRYLPSGPGFLVQADGIFSGSTLAIWKLPMSSGSTCRPAWWDEGNHDWRILEDSDWDPTRERLSFELPGAGILVPVSGRTGWTSTGTVSSGGTR